MKKSIWVLGGLGLVLCSSCYAMANPFANIPVADRVEAAKTAELKGDLARAHKDFFGAASFYRVAVKAQPSSATLQNKLGMAYLQQGNRGAASKAFRQAIKADAHYAVALNNMGAVSCLDKKYHPAVQYLKQALELDESNASAHLNLAEAWIGLGQMDRAMTEYARALELNADILSGGSEGLLVGVSTPEQRARVDFLIAQSYARKGNFEGALEYLQRAKENRFANLSKVYDDQAFAPLWSDPRLAKIIKR